MGGACCIAAEAHYTKRVRGGTRDPGVARTTQGPNSSNVLTSRVTASCHSPPNRPADLKFEPVTLSVTCLIHLTIAGYTGGSLSIPLPTGRGPFGLLHTIHSAKYSNPNLLFDYSFPGALHSGIHLSKIASVNVTACTSFNGMVSNHFLK